uniref:ATP-dependent RNA helicase n=1 Tax=Lygus hesperus TaxID=30085 RepID=A0A0A9VZ79_LYGHE
MKPKHGKPKWDGKGNFKNAPLRKKDLKELEKREISNLQSLYDQVTADNISTFDDMPLSDRTKKGLSEFGFVTPTEIQRESILIALRGLDVLGAAKTGSGKTLAFLLPVLEKLYCKQWTKFDGLGALIITPTRELAMQIYQTLVNVGKFHDFSAGLIIGGKELEFEKDRLDTINIIICTPGRLLHHMDQNPLFSSTNLQILILDEADRCLDMGFEREMNGIIENLPETRQTLLFSATQTKKVKDLARLSLSDPKYVSVHEHEKYKTPAGLTQSYLFIGQHDKLTMLWSFIKSHPKQKIIIFFATCNQVKFVFDIVCKLRPYNTLYCLNGKIRQDKRMETYQAFCRKQHAVLFATDLASRGLDFPEIHWVIHADCPEDVETYIHRSGRTARYYKGGESLLLLNPSEKRFVEILESNKIPITEIKVNPNQLVSPTAKIQAFLAKYPELKASAQRAFVSYCKSVFLMKDKQVFDFSGLDTAEFAKSLGLVATPRIRFIDKAQKSKNPGKKLSPSEEKTAPAKKAADGFNFMSDSEGEDSDDGFLKMKRVNHQLEEMSIDEPKLEEPQVRQHVLTRAKVAKRMLKKKINPNKKVLFDEEGQAILDKSKVKATDIGKSYEEADEGGLDITEAKKVMQEEDKFDRKLFREKLKAKRKELKEKLKEEAREKRGVAKAGNESSGEDSGSEPDTSWLPDPDKVYNKDNNSEDDEEGNKKIKKRKMEVEEEDSDESEDSFDGLNKREKEELALKFLSSKKMLSS